MNTSTVSFSVSFILVMIVAFLLVIIIPAAIGIYVYNDAKKRKMNAVLWALISILAPGFIGLIVYLVVRNEHSTSVCPVCSTPVAEHFTVCPSCGYALKQCCPSCKNPISHEWNICPNCANPIPESMKAAIPNNKKSDKRIIVLIAVIILIPVLLISILVSLGAYVHKTSTNIDMSINLENEVESVEPEISFGTLQTDDACNVVIVFDEPVKKDCFADITFYNEDDINYHATGQSVNAGTVNTVISFPYGAVSDCKYSVITITDNNGNLLAVSDKILLLDSNGYPKTKINVNCANGKITEE